MNEDEIDFLKKIAEYRFSNKYFARLNDVANARLNNYASLLKQENQYANKYPYRYRDDIELGKTIKERKETYIKKTVEDSLDKFSLNELIYRIPLDEINIDRLVKDRKATKDARAKLILVYLPVIFFSSAFILGAINYFFGIF